MESFISFYMDLYLSTLWITGYFFFIGVIFEDKDKNLTWKAKFIFAAISFFFYPLVLGGYAYALTHQNEYKDKP